MRIILIAILLLTTTRLHAQIIHLDPDVKKVILDSSPVSTIRRVSNIPANALKACGFKLANPDEEFQVTDCVTNEKLLDRRLIWGALKSNYLILHYERGGIGHSYHILILSKNDKGNFKIVWSASSIPFQSYDDFWDVLAGRGIDDSNSCDL
jgi:hypothetical protein